MFKLSKTEKKETEHKGSAFEVKHNVVVTNGVETKNDFEIYQNQSSPYSYRNGYIYGISKEALLELRDDITEALTK